MSTSPPTVSQTKAAIRMAERTFAEVRRAKTCADAERLMVRGERWEHVARQGLKHHLARRGDRPLTPVQRDLLDVSGTLANIEGTAHERRLQLCKISQLSHERRAWAKRAAESGGADKAIDRRERRQARRRR